MSEKNYIILVADDNQWNRDLLDRRLRRAGYTVRLVEDGTQALAAIQAGGIDLVVLDVMMPGMSGIEVLKETRKSQAPNELPIIMATAKNQSEDMVEALDAGANDYVTKPLDFPVILARVQTHLRMKDAVVSAQSESPKPVNKYDADHIKEIDLLRTGMVLAGKYKLNDKLGAGSFGSVFRAEHLGFEQPVAVKMLHSSVASAPDALARFKQEGKSTFRVQHPNAVRVLDFAVTPGGIAYLVMEMLIGRSLLEALQDTPQLSHERATEIIVPICQMLAEVHDMGLIHRDIKPANIFLHETRRGEVVKVLDFGISKLVAKEGSFSGQTQQMTVDRAILGTPAYMAPERLTGQGYDGRSDVYSLGIMLYQMLAGKPPFVAKDNQAVTVAMMQVTQQPQPLQDLCPNLPVRLLELVMQTLSKRPDERPTAAEMAQRLTETLARTQASPHHSAEQVLAEVQASRHSALDQSTIFETTHMIGYESLFTFPQLLAAPKRLNWTPHSPALPHIPGRKLQEQWTQKP